MSKSYEDGVRFGKQFSPVRLTLQLVDMERQRDEARRLAAWWRTKAISGSGEFSTHFFPWEVE